MLQSLEDRLVPSSSGVISSITDLSNHTSAFTVGQDGQIWYAQNNGWNHLSAINGTFSQVSAGLDGAGYPVCYGIQNGTGNLWEFFPAYYNQAFNLGGQCWQISATRNGECYVIGTDYTVWLGQLYYGTPSWRLVSNLPGQGGLPATQITAGVDQWGQDKVYVELQGGYVFEQNHDESYQWLYDAQRGLLKAGQISAGIGRNSTGIDLFYTEVGTNNAYYFNGSSSTYLMASATQISAGLDQWGNAILYEIYSGDHALYRSDTSGHWQYEGGQIVQISATANDMVFAVSPTQNQIWAYDPNDEWWSDWWLQSGWHYSDHGYWHWTGGDSANPNY
jgi:hypothetical protein